jgi:hypothetical protein
VQDQKNRYAGVGLVMTMSTKVWIPYLVNSMSIHQWEELKMAEKKHVIVLVPHGNQYLTQWWQKCRKLHHKSMCTHWHGRNIRNGCP